MWLQSINKSDIHPGLVSVMDEALRLLAEAGTPFKVYSGLRTFALQDTLYAKGRSKPGRVVTNARGGQSMHNYGLAVDSAPLNLLTKDPGDVWWPDPDRDATIWSALDEAISFAARGIPDVVEYEWGGRWRFRDVPHVQVRTTLSELRQGLYPYCTDVDWLVHAHTTFLLPTPWMNRRIQHLLNMLGYSAGPVDGFVGELTTNALDQFCVDRSLLGATRAQVVEELVRQDYAATAKRSEPLCED